MAAKLPQASDLAALPTETLGSGGSWSSAAQAPPPSVHGAGGTPSAGATPHERRTTVSVATSSTRRALMHPAATLALIVFTAFVVLAPRAFAYQDANANRIDDQIDRVHTEGWAAAFVDHDPTKRMAIGVANPGDVLFAIYVRYDHHPSIADRTALLATGATTAWAFVNIDAIESHATWSQIQLVQALPGVTRVE